MNRLEIIKAYFFSGLLYTEIVLLLFMIHGIKLSLRQLKRTLKANGLYRNKKYSRRADICYQQKLRIVPNELVTDLCEDD